MSKVELEAKVDALMDEINFLRAFYEAVRGPSVPPASGRAVGWRPQLGQGLLTPSWPSATVPLSICGV